LQKPSRRDTNVVVPPTVCTAQHCAGKLICKLQTQNHTCLFALPLPCLLFQADCFVRDLTLRSSQILLWKINVRARTLVRQLQDLPDR